MNECHVTALCHELSAEFQRDLKAPRAASLLAEFAALEANWLPFAFPDQNCYTRNLIFKNENFELLVLCWGVGQESPIHNHMGQNCWMAVLEGKVEEVQFSQQPGAAAGPMIDNGAKVFEQGQVAYITDEIGLHLVRAPAGSSGVSLHLYSKPYDLCHIFDPVTGEASDKVLAYHSVHGVRCKNSAGTILSSTAHGSTAL